MFHWRRRREQTAFVCEHRKVYRDNILFLWLRKTRLFNGAHQNSCTPGGIVNINFVYTAVASFREKKKTVRDEKVARQHLRRTIKNKNYIYIVYYSHAQKIKKYKTDPRRRRNESLT